MITSAQQFLQRHPLKQQKIAMLVAALLLVVGLVSLGPDRAVMRLADWAVHGGVNHQLPDIEAPSTGLSFSETPTDSAFLAVGLFAQPLTPTGKTSAAENRDLARAILDYNSGVMNGNRDAVSPLLTFLLEHPKSAWRPTLLLNIGMIYRETGHFSKALTFYNQAWAASKNLSDLNGTAIGDMAIAELSQFEAYLGRKETLQPLLGSVKGRDIHGSAEELVRSSARGLHDMYTRPEISFRCGPLALTRILLFQKGKRPEKALQTLATSYSTPNGLSLSMVQQMSVKAGMNYQMAYRPVGAPMVFPAVAHWKMGHYAAIVAKEQGRYLVQDSTFDQDIGMNEATLDEEASGYFLIPSGPLPKGWRSVSASEGAKIWGRGNTGAAKDSNSSSGSSGTPANPSDSSSDNSPWDDALEIALDDSSDENSDETKKCKGPCATWNVEAMTVSLLLHDRPLRYTPPIGPAINIDIDYSHRDVLQPQTFNYANLGAKWTVNWVSYVTDTINSNRQAALYMRGGGSETFTAASSTATSTFAGPFSQSMLTRTVNATGQSTGFKRLLKDGSSETFGVALGNKFFLTELVDPQGNKVTISYDAQFRIAGITDAIGQVTTFAYEITDPLKITKITDPFGRTAKFTYTATGQLASITDVIGITSSFTYGTGDFVSVLTTPYGTSNFTFGDSGSTRFFTAKDALGRTSRVEFNQAAWPVSETVPAPTGMGALNYYLNYRNTFIWNPEQYKAATTTAALDYSKAKIIHWLHTPDACCTSRTPESIKEPGENRVWFSYPGQSTSSAGPIYAGTSDTPIAIGRVLDDGTTQLQKFEYNGYGKVTKYTDPKGRITNYIYDTNGVDVISVTNSTSGTTQVLAQISYNSQHLPTSVTAANGTTSAYEYNSVGQLTKSTDALGNATTYDYNSSRYLTAVHGPITGADYSFTYDTPGRIASATDPAGAKVSYSYDDADRPTKVTFPDGTSSSFAYTLLDLTSTTDRLGQATSMVYDAQRQLTKVTDPLNQITQYAYTLSGRLASITDPNNHITSTTRDIQDRITAKTYADGTKQFLTYEAATSRVKTAKDALGQVTSYAYNSDDSLAAITYTNAPAVSFTYDAAYLRPTSMTDGTGSSTYSYYAVGGLGANQVRTVLSPIAGASPAIGEVITYSYDALGRVNGRNIGGATQTTGYDALGRATTVGNALDNFVYGYGDATARVSSVTSSKGPKLDLAYYGPTGDELLKQLKYTAGGKTLAQYDYEFNANDNVTKFTQSYLGQKFANLAAAPGFDEKSGGGLIESALAAVSNSAAAMANSQTLLLGMLFAAALMTGLGWLALFAKRKWRQAFMIPPILAMSLLSGCGGGGGSSSGGGGDTPPTPTPTATSEITAYAYDKAQRLLSAAIGTDLKAPTTPQYTYEYDAASNLTGITANMPKQTLAYTDTNAITTGTYDANGSPTKLDSANYTWDGANRLLTYVSGLNTSEFSYDGLSRLVRVVDKVAGIVVADHAYSWCGNARCIERDNLKPGSPVSKQYFDQGELQGANALYYVTDRLGSVRQLVDTTGTVVAQYEYDPYGNRKTILNLKDSDFGFTGLFHHSQSGLDFAVYRAYDPAHARWLNRDPIEEAGGLNLYRYVGGNVTTLNDKWGLLDQNHFPIRP